MDLGTATTQQGTCMGAGDGHASLVAPRCAHELYSYPLQAQQMQRQTHAALPRRCPTGNLKSPAGR